MQISGNTPDTLFALLKNAAATTPMLASANTAPQTKDADDTLANRPATLQNFSPATQAIIKRAEADKAVATKLQTALATLKGKDPKDTQMPEDTTSAKLFGFLNSTTVPKAISAYPIPNGDDLVQTTDARENRTVTRQELADYALGMIDPETFGDSYKDPKISESFRNAYHNGTLQFKVLDDIPDARSFINVRSHYTETGDSVSVSTNQPKLEATLGQHANIISGGEYGTIIMTWGALQPE